MFLFFKKAFVKRFVLVLFSLLFLGCQTLRMQYESTLETDKGENQKFTYVDSYDVGGAHAVLCGITGIFFGGYCWFYLVMPTTVQQQVIIDDAQTYLTKQMNGKKFEENNVRISRVSFSDGEQKASILSWSERKH